MKKHFTSFSVIAAATGLCLSLSLNAQTLYVPSGTGGIGSTSGSPNTNIGFGTSTPNNYLAGTNGLTLFGTYPGLAFATSTKTWLLYRQTDNSFRLWENSGVNVGNDRITVLPGGNLGVGVTTPSQILHVAKDGGTSGTQLLVQDLSTTYPGGIFVGSYQGNAYLQPSVAGKSLVFWDNAAERMRILSGGNVGINNPSPSAKLQVTNGSVLFDGTTGTTPVSGAGTRMMWVPAKGAFRAGAVTSTQWDDANIGYSSFAFGTNAIASGNGGSFAFGPSAIASGDGGSVAMGNGAVASGALSTSIGHNTVAQAYNSFVLGRWNYNPGTYSTTNDVATDPLFVIGNGTPLAGSNVVTILKNGNTGFGTPSPTNPLTVIATNNVESPNIPKVIAAGDPSSPTKTISLGYSTAFDAGVIASVYAGAGWKNTLINPNGGNVGIRITNPAYPLDVNGTIRANEVKVCIGTCDFVFDKNYNLISIDSLNTYVVKNHHLPGIASAKEMEAEGNVSLGKLDSQLLQKVEELTLYIVQQKQAMNEMQKEIEELKKK